jgi:hypothetical protein
MVRECRALRQSGRTTRELDIDGIIHLDIGCDRLERFSVNMRRASRDSREWNAACVNAISKRDYVPQGR